MIVDEGRHEGDSKGSWTLIKDFSNLLVFEPNHILPIHLSEVVVNQHTIPVRGEGGNKCVTCHVSSQLELTPI